MRITELKLHPIAIADPALRSSYGLHAPFALRTIVELITDDGLTASAKPTAATPRWQPRSRAQARHRRRSLPAHRPFPECRRRRRDSERAEFGRPNPDLPRPRRESTRPGLTHLCGARNRLPRSDREKQSASRCAT